MKIDWAKVKAAGIQGAIIRAGIGDVLSYPGQKDQYFEYNYSECKRLGIPVGAYFYCYAQTEAEAQREAQGCLKLIQGKQFELPILYDVEEQSVFSKGHCNEVIKAFADILEAAGWWVGIYTYKCAADAYFTERTKTRYTMAIAQYASVCTYASQHAIWQNSSTWRVDGISGNVDHDWCYEDFPTKIKAKGKNGFPKPAPKLMYKVTKDTPIVQFEGEAKAGETRQVYGRKTIDGVQYGRVTKNGYIDLRNAKQIQ
jgi:GH25 family lysozyme M1 (1,4-beta-N-acetylmuramidase)